MWKVVKTVGGVVLGLVSLLVVAVIVFLVVSRPPTAKQLLEQYKKREPVPPGVAAELLHRCQQDMTTDCLVDIAWSLSRDENRPFNLGELAKGFAKHQQWERAASLVNKIPDTESFTKTRVSAYIDGEQLARELSRGDTRRLQKIQDQGILDNAARRVMGYGDWKWGYSDQGRRYYEGFDNARELIGAAPSAQRALLTRWERLIPLGPEYRRESLAAMWILFGEPTRGRRVLEPFARPPDSSLRYSIGLWLELGDPKRAAELIEASKPRDRGLYKWVIARWYKQKGDDREALSTATDAAEDLLAGKEYSRLLPVVQLFTELKKADLAQQVAAKAERVAHEPDPFRPFNLSAAGAMFGLAGDAKECLRLQREALGLEPAKGETVAYGLISGPISYGRGIFDLDKSLREQVANRRVGCGDRSALKEVNNTMLSREYCDYYGRGLIGLADISERRDMEDAPLQILMDRAIECHFELGETAIAMPLLQKYMNEAKASVDVPRSYSVAELACVYGSEALCHDALRTAWQAYIRSVSERKMTAQSIMNFASVWERWGPKGTPLSVN